jgi:hypothetical protein
MQILTFIFNLIYYLNMTSDDVGNIFNKILLKYNNEIQKVDEQRLPIMEKSKELMKLLTRHIRKDCFDIINFFEQNGTIEEDLNGLKFDLSPKVDKNISGQKFNELDQCLKKNGKEVMNMNYNLDQSLQMIKVEFNSCGKHCRGMDDESSEACYTTCIHNTISQMKTLYESTDKKLDEMMDKLII